MIQMLQLSSKGFIVTIINMLKKVEGKMELSPKRLGIFLKSQMKFIKCILYIVIPLLETFPWFLCYRILINFLPWQRKHFSPDSYLFSLAAYPFLSILCFSQIQLLASHQTQCFLSCCNAFTLDALRNWSALILPACPLRKYIFMYKSPSQMRPFLRSSP